MCASCKLRVRVLIACCLLVLVWCVCLVGSLLLVARVCVGLWSMVVGWLVGLVGWLVGFFCWFVVVAVCGGGAAVVEAAGAVAGVAAVVVVVGWLFAVWVCCALLVS